MVNIPVAWVGEVGTDCTGYPINGQFGLVCLQYPRAGEM